MATRVEMPGRSTYKPSEVCAIAGLPPYVLRSWESEFADLGVAQRGGRPRRYRREDLDRVLRIKELVFSEGLTLGAARRQLLKEGPKAGRPEPEAGKPEPKAGKPEPKALDVLTGDEVRARLNGVKKGLHAILELLAERKA